ncbi:MAG: hypothetical protein WDO74_23435 [Pseudomonadota bacterium]
MASTKKITTRAPIAKADLLDRVALAMRLLALASDRAHQAQLNVDLAKVGLAELIVDIEQQGVAS